MNEKIKPLSPEQKKLAADNHNLIYSFAYEHGINVEDYYGLLAIGLCKAATLFDPSCGFKFSTFAYRCMRNEFSNQIHSERYLMRCIPENKIVSGYETITDSKDPLRIIDMIAEDRERSPSFDTTQVWVDEFVRTVPEKRRTVLKGLMEDKTVVTVAEEVGCTKQNVSRIRNLLKEDWKTYCIKRYFY